MVETTQHQDSNYITPRGVDPAQQTLKSKSVLDEFMSVFRLRFQMTGTHNENGRKIWQFESPSRIQDI